MKITAAIAIATLAMVSAAPGVTTTSETSTKSQGIGGYEHTVALQGAQGAMTNHQQVQDTLNNQLKTNNVHANADRLVAYITGADSQIDNAIATVSRALGPLTGGLSVAIGNVLLGPFVQSVTNGAEVFLANMVGSAEDRLSAEQYGRITGDYSRLAELAVKNNVDASKLINLNKQITNSIPKSKRGVTTTTETSTQSQGQSQGLGGYEHTVALQGAQGAMTNHQQVQDTLNNQLKTNNVHANADRLVAYITGADSQIDNAIATVSRALGPLTGGVSVAIGNFLLGPFVQSVTNGAEVFLANMVGGAEDRLSAEQYGRITGDYSRLAQLAVKNNVDASKLINLNKQITNSIPKSKRGVTTTSETSSQSQGQSQGLGGYEHTVALQGAQGAMTNHQQVQDTLNNQLKTNNVHANADRLVAYITGADSQIDNAIATVSRALGPLTGGLSVAIGNVLLGPFVQSVTNGAEVFLANMIGGAEDRVSAEQYGRITGDYSRLAELAVKNNVDASKLINLNKQITNSIPKSKK